MARTGRRVDAAGGCQALSDTDTIVALSSGAPPAAIAIVRISGPAAVAAATALAGPLPPSRRAGVRTLRSAAGDLLDRALVLVFPLAGSATGEDLVELHCHGGKAVVAAVQQAIVVTGLARPAVAGEFTRRALLNGRIDLAQAQGLADLLTAETETQRRLAVRAAEGEVGQAIRGWLDRLTALAAEVEAGIEFGEEGDVAAEGASMASVRAATAALAAEIGAVLATPAVERWRDGWRVVVAGPPNAGKSTLINLLAQRDVAIVSSLAGTTRDVIEVAVQRGGEVYVLTDTAGLRNDAGDPIEALGIDRARRAARGADLLLWVDDTPPSDTDTTPTLWIWAKADLPRRQRIPVGAIGARHDRPAMVEAVWQAVEMSLDYPLAPIPLHDDQRAACRAVVAELAIEEADLVLLAEHLRIARRTLSTILGIDATEALLDSIFGRFCVGK